MVFHFFKKFKINYNITFFNILSLLNIIQLLFISLNIKDYFFIWKSKINKRSYIVKWFNNNARYRLSTDLIGYKFFSNNKQNKIKNYFWLNYYHKTFKYKSLLYFLNFSKELYTILYKGSLKFWKVKKSSGCSKI